MLTDRQLEVADHLLSGLTLAQIAQRMGISAGTLKTYLYDMRQRTSADGHQQLMGRLREIRRDPATEMVERCRAEPRAWWTV
jgi:DNA-binding CsgD family transcriptional regulator